MIEKFPVADSAYTYGNIERGCISGLEFEFQCFPLKKLEFFGNGFYYRGSGNGGALNDVPSAKFSLGTKLWLGRLWGEVDWLAAAALRRPGPAEVAVDAYQVFDLKAGCIFPIVSSCSPRSPTCSIAPILPTAIPTFPWPRGSISPWV